MHTIPEAIVDRSNGDVAANSYQLYKEDVKAVKQIGVKLHIFYIQLKHVVYSYTLINFKQAQFYRFSISWSRILPTGDISQLNEPGLQYYDNLIDELLANGIQPMITMYHNDLPQALQEMGGWTNRYVVDYFEQYAKVLYARYADRVKVWITFNEPTSFCVSGYSGRDAPRLMSPGVGIYLCIHNILLSHARAYRLYHADFFAKYSGKVSIALDGTFAFPQDANKRSDVEAAERRIQFGVIYTNAISLNIQYIFVIHF